MPSIIIFFLRFTVESFALFSNRILMIVEILTNVTFNDILSKLLRLYKIEKKLTLCAESEKRCFIILGAFKISVFICINYNVMLFQ